MAEETKLDKLKKEYEKIQKKHKLPVFEKLNEDFGIEELVGVETDFLIRKVRAKLADHLSRVARFLEGILNPANNSSIFMFSLVKLVDPSDKEMVSKIYKDLMKLEIEIIKIDIDFNEQGEASFIKDYFEVWQGAKKELAKFIDSIEKKWDGKSESKSKGYYG